MIGTKTIALTILICVVLFFVRTTCQAQNKIAPAEYDYHSLALASVLNSAKDASNLPDIPQRVSLLIYAAKILAPSQRDEAVRLLDVALADVRNLASEDKANWYQRHTAAILRNDVLALYSALNPEKARTLQKEIQPPAESTANNAGTASLRTDAWFMEFSNRRANADQPAQIALSLVDTNPDKAFTLILQSFQAGAVSGVLYKIVEKLVQNDNRAFLNRLETGISKILAETVTLDPFSLAYVAALLQADKEMQPVTKNVFVSFLMRSVEAWSNLVTDPSENGRINASYIRTVFSTASLSVRPIILQYAPEQLLLFEQMLDRVAPLVSAETRLRLQGFQPETFSDPRDRLNDILKDPAPPKRDLRLVRLVAELLRNESGDFQNNLDLGSEAISGFSDTDIKTAYTDLLTITRMNAFAKQKKFIEAQQLAGSISSQETRAWALLALSAMAAKENRILGFELISNALKALDKASPSPHKVELALTATAMLANGDPQRAFDTFSAASKYANSSPSKVNPPSKPPVAFGLEATIGEAHTRLGVFPESLGKLQILPSLSVLGTTDWFRADHIVNDIRDPYLRLQLKLQLAEAILAPVPKSKRTTPKPSN
jgi:hypothetical protein